MKTVREIISSRIKEEWLDKTARDFLEGKYINVKIIRSADGVRWFVKNKLSTFGAGFTEESAWEQAAERILFNV